MRVRIKAERTKVALAGGKILSVGVRDRETKKDIWAFDLSSDKATGEYEWYDVGEWVEEGRDSSLYVNTYGGTFSIDCLEIQRLSEPN